jgi:CBS domain containing-hemolysin-like protein
MSLLILFIVLSIGFSFLCSVLEAVLLSVNAAYIEILEEKSPKAGKLFKKLKLDIDKSIASILILNTIAHTLGAAGVGAQAAKLYGNDVVFYVSAILTLLILIFSEIIPKTIGTVYWKQLAPFTAYTINVLIYVTYPLIVITQFLTKKISKDGLHMNTMSKEELIATTLLGEDQGIIDEQESDMIENVLRLDDIKLQSILTPRSVVFWASRRYEYSSSFRRK